MTSGLSLGSDVLKSGLEGVATNMMLCFLRGCRWSLREVLLILPSLPATCTVPVLPRMMKVFLRDFLRPL